MLSIAELEARYAPCLRPFEKRLVAEELLAEVARGTGLVDWGGEDFREGRFRERLALLCESLESEAEMSALGRSRAHSRMYFNLAGRLGVVDWQRKNPNQKPIKDPMIGTGFGRSGTSFFHQLLALDPENLTAPMGECWIPTPPPGDPAFDAARMDLVQRMMDFSGISAPEIAAAHPFEPDNAAECLAIQAHAIGTEYQAFWYAPSFLKRAHADYPDLLHWQEAVLQTLQSGKSGHRWLLKTPEHLSHWEESTTAFPQARIYINHRDPAKTVPSMFSMMAAFQKLTSDRPIDVAAVVKQTVTVSMAPMHKVMAWRKAHPDFKVVDVHYKQMLADPIGEAERVYAEFGLSLTPAARKAMEAFVKDNQHAHGPKHKYSLADFGMTEAEIENVYGEYLDTYGIARERER